MAAVLSTPIGTVLGPYEQSWVETYTSGCNANDNNSKRVKPCREEEVVEVHSESLQPRYRDNKAKRLIGALMSWQNRSLLRRGHDSRKIIQRLHVLREQQRRSNSDSSDEWCSNEVNKWPRQRLPSGLQGATVLSRVPYLPFLVHDGLVRFHHGR